MLSKFILFIMFLGSNFYAQTIEHSSINFDLSNNLKKNSINYVTSKIENNSVVYTSNFIEVPLKNVEPILGVGLRAEYPNEDQSAYVFMRASVDSSKWTAWREYEQVQDEKEAIIIGELLFFDKNTKFVQFKIVINRNETNTTKQIKNIYLGFISPGATPKDIMLKNLATVNERELVKTSPNGIESYSRPSYVNRASWNCPQAENTTARTLTTVKHIVLHHSAGNTTSSDFAAVVRGIWDWHVNHNGWADIGYNWLVDPNGVLYKARAWYSSTQENVQGAHNSGKNANTVGVCFIGDYMTNTPSSVGLDKVEDIMAYLCDHYSLDPLGTVYVNSTLGTKYSIEGHRNSGGGTDCPGDNLYAHMNEIRANVNSKLNGGTTTNTDPSIIDDFEISVGHFDKSPTYSGSTQGIDASSTLTRTTDEGYNSSSASLKAIINDNTNSSDNWKVRLLSGTGNPANNQKISSTKKIGFWIKTSSAPGNAKASIWIDDSDGLEASVEVDIENDGTWHFYSWALADSSKWGVPISGNGQIDADSVTIDAIYLTATQSASPWTLYIDDVKYEADSNSYAGDNIVLDLRTNSHGFVINDNGNNDLDQTSAYTIEFWLNVSSQTAYDRILHSNSFSFFTLNPIGSEDFRLRYDVGGNSYTYSLKFNTWYHILVSYDGDLTRCYLDGTGMASASNMQHTAIDYISVGGKWDGTSFSNYGKFAIDDLRFSNIARAYESSFSISKNDPQHTNDSYTIFLFQFQDKSTPPSNKSSKVFSISNSSIISTDFKTWDDASFADALPQPVELSNFTVKSENNSNILEWETATEVNNYGFEVQSSSGSSKSEFVKIGFVPGAGNSNSPKQYSFVDNNTLGGAVKYRLKQIDTDGNFEYSDVVAVNREELTKIELFQNFPNPFNPSTQISFKLNETQKVRLTVYNALGQKVIELVNKQMESGVHTIDFNASNLTSGLYLYRIETTNYSKTMKMLLLK